MGATALQGNGITAKLLYLIRDKTLSSPYDPLHKVRKSRLLLFVTVQLMGFGATFAITQTIGTTLHLDQLLFTDFGAAAIGFPVIILLLVPLRTYGIPRLPFTQEELSILDGPTASPFVSLLFLYSLATSCTLRRQWNLSVDLKKQLESMAVCAHPDALSIYEITFHFQD